MITRNSPFFSTFCFKYLSASGRLLSLILPNSPNKPLNPNRTLPRQTATKNPTPDLQAQESKTTSNKPAKTKDCQTWLNTRSGRIKPALELVLNNEVYQL